MTNDEIDKLIHIKVMGLSPDEESKKYSSDMNAAMEVVRKFVLEKGIDISAKPRSPVNAPDVVHYTSYPPNEQPITVESAPKAICLAALVAVGHK